MPDRIGNRLAQTVFLRNFKIGNRTWIIAADLNRIYDVFGTAQRFFSVCIRFNDTSAAACFLNIIQHVFGICKTLRINIEECNFVSCNAGVIKQSPSTFLAKTVLPAPIKVILDIGSPPQKFCDFDNESFAMKAD